MVSFVVKWRFCEGSACWNFPSSSSNCSNCCLDGIAFIIIWSIMYITLNIFLLFLFFHLFFQKHELFGFVSWFQGFQIFKRLLKSYLCHRIYRALCCWSLHHKIFCSELSRDKEYIVLIHRFLANGFAITVGALWKRYSLSFYQFLGTSFEKVSCTVLDDCTNYAKDRKVSRGLIYKFQLLYYGLYFAHERKEGAIWAQKLLHDAILKEPTISQGKIKVAMKRGFASTDTTSFN